MKSIWSVWGPFVVKEVPWAWGCSAFNIPLTPQQQDVTLAERQTAFGGLMLIVFSRALLEPIKLLPPLLGAKVTTAEQERQNYQLKKPTPSPLFYSWKNILLPSLFLFFLPHMEWIFGILMFRCHVCLTYFFDNAFLGSKPEVFLHVFQLGKTPSVSTGPLPK